MIGSRARLTYGGGGGGGHDHGVGLLWRVRLGLVALDAEVAVLTSLGLTLPILFSSLANSNRDRVGNVKHTPESVQSTDADVRLSRLSLECQNH